MLVSMNENVKIRRSGTPQPLMRASRECTASPTRQRSMNPEECSRMVQPTVRLDSLLFKAAADRKWEAVDFLLTQARVVGLDVNMAMPEWDISTRIKLGPMTLLARACFIGDIGLAFLLHARGASLDSHQGLALRAAVTGCQPESVRFLFEKGARMPDLASEELQGPLELAAESGDFELIRLLVSSGSADPAGFGAFHRLLVAAASKGHLRLVSYLLDLTTHDDQSQPPHLDIESQIGSAVQAATSNRHWPVVRLLLDRIHDPHPSHLCDSESDTSEDISDIDNSLVMKLPPTSPPAVSKAIRQD